MFLSSVLSQLIPLKYFPKPLLFRIIYLHTLVDDTVVDGVGVIVPREDDLLVVKVVGLLVVTKLVKLKPGTQNKVH